MFFLSRSVGADARGRSALRKSAPAGASGSRTVELSLCTKQTATARGTAPFVVACAAGKKIECMTAVKTFGGRVIGPWRADALLVELNAVALARVKADGRFTAATELDPSEKVQTGFAGGEATVVALTEADVTRMTAFVEDNGGEILRAGPCSRTAFRARVPAELLVQLVKRGEIRWIERFVPPKLLNDFAVDDTGVRTVWNDFGLTGKGQVLASADSGLDTGNVSTLHGDFAGRIVGIVNLGGFTLADFCGHGTHTAGTLVGDGTASAGQYRGVAHAAKLFVQACGGTSTDDDGIYFNNARTYDDVFAGGLAQGAYIHSDSWGGDNQGAYTDWSHGLDDVVWRNPEILVVVANGNYGAKGHTVGAPATAKNCLSVGNGYSSRDGDDIDELNLSSSPGPCQDGRIKPEVFAPGTSIVSTRSSKSATPAYSGMESYTMMSGTSMATPHVAGCAALVREWLVERRGFTNALPTAALMKAILTGGAWKAGTLADNVHGWGRIDLAETLYPSNRAVRLIDRIPFARGESRVYPLSLTNDAPLEVQLTWIDYPGTLGADQALINDLDLIVSNRTTGAVWRGNGVAGGDRTNTVESVRLPLAAAGDYDLIVRGVSVLHGSDEGGAAALYVRGAFENGEEPKPAPDLYVDAAAGSDETGTGAPDAPFRSIAAALRETPVGGTVHVRPGSYAPVVAPVTPVRIVAEGVCGSTVIDGGGTNRCYDGSANPGTVLSGFTLINGYTEEFGGGAYSATLSNCVIRCCEAAFGGGASDSRLTHCTVCDNMAYYGGGGVDYDCTCRDSIVWDNFLSDGTTDNWYSYREWMRVYKPVFSFSCTTPTGFDDRGGNVVADPLLADVRRGDVRLLSGTPCLGTASDGTNMGAYQGEPAEGCAISVRVTGGGYVTPASAYVACGGSVTFEASDDHPFLRFETNGVFATTERIFEWRNITASGTLTAHFAATDFHVDPVKGSDANDGWTWETAMRTIGAALAVMSSGETVHVRPGTYREQICPPGPTVNIVSTDGPASTTVIPDGEYPCFYGGYSPSTFLSGFTLEGGVNWYGGGALYGVISNCVIRNCRAVYSRTDPYSGCGGGAYAADLYDCVITGCTAERQGGGAGYAYLERCTVRGNCALKMRSGLSELAGGGVDWECVCLDTILRENVNAAGDEDNWEAYIQSAEQTWVPELYFCCTVPWISIGVGNLFTDPRFAGEGSDVRLYEISPCIGAGLTDSNIGAYRGSGVVIPIPDLPSGATAADVSNAVERTGYVDPKVPDYIGGDATRYEIFQRWATGEIARTTAVVLSERAYDSFRVREIVAAPTLLADGCETELDITDIAMGSVSGWEVTIVLKDGGSEVRLKAAREAYAGKVRLGTRPDALVPATAADIEAAAPAGAAVRLRVKRPAENAGFADIRIR